MSSFTNNLNLELPSYQDSADVEVINENFRKVDEYLGPNGVPKITVQDIEGGHRITITDNTGTVSFNVMNPGGNGATYDQSLNTTDDVTFNSVTADAVYGAVFME